MKSATNQPLSDGYSRHIGRVGALAVALGVGMAVAMNPGLAWGDPGADGAVDGATSATDATNTDATADAAAVGKSQDAPDGPAAAATTTTSRAAETFQSSSETTQTNTVTTDVVVRSSGGALTSDHYTDDPSAVPVAEPTTGGAEVDSESASTTIRPSGKTPEVIATERYSPPPASIPSATKIDATPTSASRGETSVRTFAVDAVQFAPQLLATRTNTFAAAPLPVPTPRAVDPLAALVTMPASIIATATNLIAAVFTSLLGPTPGAPAEPPLLWAVLALVRRQFVNETPSVVSTVSAPDSLGKITISLSATDRDGDPLVYSATGGTKGTVAVNPDGHSFTYTPNAGQAGTDTLTITASDATTDHVHGLPGLINALTFGLLGNAGHVSAPTGVTVALNTPPKVTLTAGAVDTATGAVTVTMVATDPDGDPLTVTVTSPAGGTGTVGMPTLVDAATGTYSIVYTPSDEARHTASADTASAAQKADGFTVTVSDGHGATLVSTVGVTIAASNDAPELANVTATADVTGKVTGSVVFTDGDSDMLTYSGSAATAKGSVVVNADGTFVYTPTDLARYGADITDGSDVDTFAVTVRDGYGAVVVTSVTVTVTPLSVAGETTAAMAAAVLVLDEVIDQRAAAQAALQDALNSLAGLNPSIDPNDVSILLADLKATTDAEAAREVELRLDQLLGVTLDDDERIVLAIKAAAIRSADTALSAPIYAYLDAQALQVAQLSVVPPYVNYSPVLSRIVTRTDPRTGVITGTVVFVDRENQPVRVDLVVVRVPGSAFDAIVHVDEQTGAFTFIPVTPPSVPRPSTLKFRVGGVDDSVPDIGATVFEGQLDYTAQANVILGPGAGALAGTTVSVPVQTRQERAAEVDRRVAELEREIDAGRADLESRMASLNVSLLASSEG